MVSNLPNSLLHTQEKYNHTNARLGLIITAVSSFRGGGSPVFIVVSDEEKFRKFLLDVETGITGRSELLKLALKTDESNNSQAFDIGSIGLTAVPIAEATKELLQKLKRNGIISEEPIAESNSRNRKGIER